MPEPMMAPMPSAVSDQGPSVFLRRWPGSSASAISLSIDLQANNWLPGPGETSDCTVGVCAKQALLQIQRRSENTRAWIFYRLACPRASFLTLRFCEPRAYSRGFRGFSALRFLREARFDFLRSSLLRFLVLAMIPFLLRRHSLRTVHPKGRDLPLAT